MVLPVGVAAFDAILRQAGKMADEVFLLRVLSRAFACFAGDRLVDPVINTLVRCMFFWNKAHFCALFFFVVTENHAIVAWLERGFADERKQTRGDRRICVKGSLREGAPAKRVREHAKQR